MTELLTLGTLELRATQRDAAAPARLTPKDAALLVYLALAHPRGFHSRDRLIGVFWPEMPRARARAALSQAVYRLRQKLGGQVLVTRGDDEISVDVEVLRCDAVVFEALVEERKLDEALEVYGGDLLAGFHPVDGRDFDEWLEAERTRLRERARDAVRALVETLVAEGNPAAAVRHLRRALAWSPYDDALAAALLKLLHRLGDRAGAIREYDAFARRLAEDLELEPAPELGALVEEIRAPAAAGIGTLDLHADFAPSDQPLRTGDAQPRTEGERSPARGIRRPARTRAFALAAAATIAAIMLVGAAGFAGWNDAVHGGDASATRIAVLPFSVRGSDDLAYLGVGVVDLLSMNLEGAGPLRSVDAHAILDFMRQREAGGASIDDGRAVAARFGAGQFVVGSVLEAGGRVSIRATLHDANGSLRAEVSTATGGEADLFALIDELARKLVASQYGGETQRLSRLAALTTHSLPALKAYLAGEREFRAGRFVGAADAFHRAVREDSTFALAYYRLSLASLWADQQKTWPADADQRALRHSRRLSQRDRLLVEAYVAWRHGAADSAEFLYRRIVSAYPSDAEAWFQLGETLFHYNPLRGLPVAGSRAAFEEVLRLSPDHWEALWHLALIAAGEGRTDDFELLTDRLLELEPGGVRTLEIRALRSFASAHDAGIDTALEADLLQADEIRLFSIFWRLGVNLHDIEGAQRVARLLVGPQRPRQSRIVGHRSLFYLDMAHGRLRDAVAELATLESLASAQVLPDLEPGVLFATFPLMPTPVARASALRERIADWEPERPGAGFCGSNEYLRRERLYYLGLLSAALDDSTRSRARATQLHDMGDGRWGFGGHVAARVAWMDGRPEEALRLLEASWAGEWFGCAVGSPSQSQALARYTRAEILRELGRDAEALRWYATFGENTLHDLMYLAPSHLRRAQIHERLGADAEAARHYDRFIELWHEADPDLRPLVDDARRRRQALLAAG